MKAANRELALVPMWVLPFEMHHQGQIEVGRMSPGPEGWAATDDWTRRAIAVAETALRGGLQISVKVPPDLVAHQAATVARMLKGKAYMGYNADLQRLLIWYAEEDHDLERELDEDCDSASASA